MNVDNNKRFLALMLYVCVILLILKSEGWLCKDLRYFKVYSAYNHRDMPSTTSTLKAPSGSNVVAYVTTFLKIFLVHFCFDIISNYQYKLAPSIKQIKRTLPCSFFKYKY